MESTELVRTYMDSKNDLPFKSKFASATKLSGGLANYVYRLKFEDDTTAILKYYPRYLACDKSVEVSQNRYFVEKAALKHLSTNEYLLNETAVRVPKLFYADDESHMLIMEDAGEDNKTLFQLLKNENTESDVLVPFIAEQIKKFSTFLSDKSGIKAKTHLEEFRNSTAWHIIPSYYSQVFKTQAKELGLEDELQTHLNNIDVFTEPNYENSDPVFIFGDLWPNSILINVEKKLAWIVDWEMARFKTNLCDLQQLIGNMWIMKQNSNLFNSNRIERLIKRLQFEFFGDENLDWRKSCQNGQSTFVFWAVVLIKEHHWQIANKKDSILQALREIQ